jgi:GH15 family glucan-1,4-alpha-glucosidase
MPEPATRSTPLEDYALLGDRRTAALVSRSGSVDWWCVPRFDGGACFAALLGGRDQGRFRIAPREESRETWQYRRGTMVLETEHETAHGRVRVIDCLALGHARPTLVRLVEGVEGTVEMDLDLVVRFDYGSILPWVRSDPGAWRAVAGPDGLELRTPVSLRGENMSTVANFRVNAGERVPFVLGWFPSHDRKPVEEDAVALVDRTTADWVRWWHRCDFGGSWSPEVQRSLITLEALTFAPTGGIVAAPTTSLPEALGGSRNWDYRYCWVRDASLTLEALLIGAYQDEADRWRNWLARACAGAPEELQVLYGVGGERRLPELELDWLPGYASSQPIRIGNAAHEQLQLDVFGELLDVAWQATRAGAPPLNEGPGILEVFLEHLEQVWREPDEGIWEVRGPRRHFTHSKVMCWVAFDRAVLLAQEGVLEGPTDRWCALRDEIHDEVCARAFNTERNTFVQSYDSDELDASVLMIPLVGFLPGDDSRVLGTIEAIERDLTRDGFVQRYDPRKESVDGIGEPEGVFLPCSFWMVEALALAGRKDDAVAMFRRLLEVANDLGLFAEEYDVEHKRMVGNFPQAFTHLALVTAAHTLEPEASPDVGRRRDRHM